MQSEQPMIHNVPLPLHDELALGLLGRFARLNGLSSITWATKSLKSGQPDGKNTPLLWLIADVCGQDRSVFSANHSMLPAMSPISIHADSAQVADGTYRRIHQRGMRLPTGQLRWCQACSDMDVEERGFSHWRRQHQIMGVDWCVEHHLPLISTSTDSAIYTPGHPATHSSLCTTQANTEEEMHNPALQRMLQIMFRWLHRPNPIRLAAWVEVVSERCRNADLRMGEIGKRPVASDLIQEAFPASWLARHLPEIASKEPRSFVRKVDGAYIDKHVAYPALACATILAVLFDTAEYALDALEVADSRLATPRPTGNVSDEALTAFLAGLGLHEACEKFGANIESVEAALRLSLQQQLQLVDTPVALA
ncbi:TniQ family protein [Aquitalea sp.]|uniref:TniQ family protein n=1 Tax=Aquitalea sp. TaxID=1872623 RepID=UPI00258256ED|nr:TniQ family protein [Aquitalea sp.]